MGRILDLVGDKGPRRLILNATQPSIEKPRKVAIYLSEDTERFIRQAWADERISLSQSVNDAIRLLQESKAKAKGKKMRRQA